MMRFILSLCSAVVLCGAMSSPLLAAPGHAAVGHGAVGHGAVGHGPARVAGFGAGHYPAGYVARDFRGWGNSYFDARYRTQFFYYPAAGAYYYWYAPGACYLPVSQIALYPPTVTIVNNVNVGGPALPMPPY